MPSPGRRFDRAFQLARELHAGQLRKGTKIPYISHLMGVASLVLEDGGDEDEAIAALLHDAVEDQGGPQTLGQIRQLFGKRVAGIVKACSDTDVTPKPPWRARKEAYIAHLHDPGLPPGTLRVSLADKLHNARAILFDLRAGHDVFGRFNAPRTDQLWYYDALAAAFCQLVESPMAAELRRTVDELASA
jgi:GTP pyrophosphokinase